MKAVTLRQPWASFVASGVKPLINKAYPVPLDARGERIAIHAGKAWDDNWNDTDCCECMRRDWDGSPVGGGECDYCKTVEWGDGYESFAKEVSGRILCTARLIAQFEPRSFSALHFETNQMEALCRECGGDGNNPDYRFQQWIDYSPEPEDIDYSSYFCPRCSGSGWDFDFRTWGFRDFKMYGWILSEVELISSTKVYRGRPGLWTIP